MFKIVVFWGKPSQPKNPNPLARIGKKLPVYMELFEKLSKRASVYVVLGYDNYLGGMKFKKPFRFERNEFIKLKHTIVADVAYDRSTKTSFPAINNETDRKVVNCNKFKMFCDNKWEFYKRFKKYCPETHLAPDTESLKKVLSRLHDNKIFVAKPFNGMRGNGIIIGKKNKIEKLNITIPYLIQEFKNTRNGIPGITKGIHDFRVVIVNGKPVWTTVRKPAPRKLLANVAQGGSIQEIPISKIPKSVLPIINHLTKSFKKSFHNPLFSIDFGFENGKPFIFEINDQIGFPLPTMKYNCFLDELVKLLVQKASL